MITALAHDASHNRPTQFEVEVIIDGTRQVAGYTARKTKNSLIAVALDNETIRAQMLAALPADDNSAPCYNARQGWTLGNTIIRWSGGTLRHPA